jgi:hypothetical protein
VIKANQVDLQMLQVVTIYAVTWFVLVGLVA